jgi:hypothetical protein
MLLSEVYEVPTAVSLLVVAVVLGAATALSLAFPKPRVHAD